VTADLYCSRADVNRRLPFGSIVSSAAIVASSLATSNVVTCDGHGLETNDAITVRAAEGGSLSAPLVEGTTYYVRRINASAFELAATVGGAAIDITSDAIEMMVIREPSYDEHIEFYSRWADAFLPAHLVPLQAPIHPTVLGIVADLAAKKILAISGQDSKILDSAELASKAMLERFAAGLPLRGAAVTASANLAVTSSNLTADARGWGSGSLP
jgi:hypothetical protein